MKALNKRAIEIFNKLIQGLTQPGDHKKIDNTSGTFMALSIDVLEVIPGMMRVSLAHNYLQQGDVMADPDVEFAVLPTGVFPLTFQQDNLGIYRRWAWQENGQWQFHSRGQADLAAFCNQWMRNIHEQQGLDKKTDARRWKCPECGHTEEIDQDWLADHGEPVCGKCDVDMELQPKAGGI